MGGSGGLIDVCVEAFAYECAMCGKHSTPSVDEGTARANALAEGVFKDGAWYCDECAAYLAVSQDDECSQMEQMETWECPVCYWQYAPCGPLRANGAPEVMAVRVHGLVPGTEIVREVYYCPVCGRALDRDKDMHVVPVPESREVWQKRLATWVASVAGGGE